MEITYTVLIKVEEWNDNGTQPDEPIEVGRRFSTLEEARAYRNEILDVFRKVNDGECGACIELRAALKLKNDAMDRIMGIIGLRHHEYDWWLKARMAGHLLPAGLDQL